MNEIERAIIVWSNPSHWNDDAWNQGAIQEAKETALAALRAQAERSKGCEWCKPPYKSLLTVELGEFESGDMAMLYIETDGQNIRAYDNDPQNSTIEAAKIHFCPMCGKKL